MRSVVAVLVIFAAVSGQQAVGVEPFEFFLDNVAPALDDESDPRASFRRAEGELPIVVEPFDVHVRAWGAEKPDFSPRPPVEHEGLAWYGSETGLYSEAAAGGRVRHEAYAVDGPLTSHVTSLAVDSKGSLWVGTPLGISVRAPRGDWRHVRGRDGRSEGTGAAYLLPYWMGRYHGFIAEAP